MLKFFVFMIASRDADWKNIFYLLRIDYSFFTFHVDICVFTQFSIEIYTVSFFINFTK